jgi:hypothetical protein
MNEKGSISMMGLLPPASTKSPKLCNLSSRMESGRNAEAVESASQLRFCRLRPQHIVESENPFSQLITTTSGCDTDSVGLAR